MAERQGHGITGGKITTIMMATRKKKWFASAGLLLWIIFLIKHVSVLHGHEIASLDYFTHLREPRNWDSSNIVLLSITDDDYEKIFKESNPLNPDKIIKMLSIIASAKPAVIAVDVDTTNEHYHNAIKFLYDEHGQPPSIPIIWAAQAREMSEPAGSHLSFKPDASVLHEVILGGMYSPPKPWFVGISNLFKDNGEIRRYKWRYKTEDSGIMDSLSLATLRAACPASQPHSAFQEKMCKKLSQLETECPNVCLESAFIRFSMSNPPKFSFGDVLGLSPQNAGGKVDTDWQNAFRGKIVFIGSEYSEDDNRYRSVAGQLFAVRIHAEALAAAISDQQNEIIWVKPRWQIILWEILALCALYFAQHWIRNRALRLSVTFLGAVLLSTLLSRIAFQSALLLINFLPLLSGVFLDVIKDVVKGSDAIKSVK
jgi:CHASE2 domain-containing sensor protein